MKEGNSLEGRAQAIYLRAPATFRTVKLDVAIWELLSSCLEFISKPKTEPRILNGNLGIHGGDFRGLKDDVYAASKTKKAAHSGRLPPRKACRSGEMICQFTKSASAAFYDGSSKRQPDCLPTITGKRGTVGSSLKVVSPKFFLNQVLARIVTTHHPSRTCNLMILVANCRVRMLQLGLSKTQR